MTTIREAVMTHIGRKNGHQVLCCTPKCRGFACYRLGAAVWPVSTPHSERNEETATRLMFPLHVCRECEKTLTAAAIIDDLNWKKLAQAVTCSGRPMPDRSSIQLMFVPLVAE